MCRIISEIQSPEKAFITLVFDSSECEALPYNALREADANITMDGNGAKAVFELNPSVDEEIEMLDKALEKISQACHLEPPASEIMEKLCDEEQFFPQWRKAGDQEVASSLAQGHDKVLTVRYASRAGGEDYTPSMARECLMKLLVKKYKSPFFAATVMKRKGWKDTSSAL